MRTCHDEVLCETIAARAQVLLHESQLPVAACCGQVTKNTSKRGLAKRVGDPAVGVEPSTCAPTR